MHAGISMSPKRYMLAHPILSVHHTQEGQSLEMKLALPWGWLDMHVAREGLLKHQSGGVKEEAIPAWVALARTKAGMYRVMLVCPGT